MDSSGLGKGEVAGFYVRGNELPEFHEMPLYIYIYTVKPA